MVLNFLPGSCDSDLMDFYGFPKARNFSSTHRTHFLETMTLHAVPISIAAISFPRCNTSAMNKNYRTRNSAASRTTPWIVIAGNSSVNCTSGEKRN